MTQAALNHGLTKTAIPVKSTLLTLITRCNSVKSFKQIHAQLLISGFIQDSSIQSQIIGFFVNSDDLVYAHETLNQIHHGPHSFLFNSLIAAYAGSKMPEAAILVYRRMVGGGFTPDMYTFPAILKSCAKGRRIGECGQVHGMAAKMGIGCDLYVQNALVHVYSVCGDSDGACKMFDEMVERDVVSWTGLISGYVRRGLFGEVMGLFRKMDVEPNVATLVSVIVACGRLGDLEMGRVMHGLVFKREFGMGLVVGNALLDMYVKCECLDEAKWVFDELPMRDIVSWTSMISGLVQCKHPKAAVDVFRDMQTSGVEPDKVTLASVLSACASLGALDCGRWVHEYIDRKSVEWDAHIGTALVDMYAKCGCIEMALRIFYHMNHKNIYSWNALLGGLAIHGHGKAALDHFNRMVSDGTQPNEVTFLAILSACCHSGLVDDGRQWFKEMTRVYNLTPRIEHYGCMVDLLGRAGLLDEAHDLIKSMPMQADVLILGSMLSACKAHGDVRLSQQMLGYLHELESHDSGVYVLLSNTYAINDRWEEVVRVRSLMKDKGIRKSPGSSVIEVNGHTHEFLVGDYCNHPQQEEIYLMLDMLMRLVNLEGHA
ncbi:pentatricopeptide repeat-containing protein At4g38010 [Magnolia sinica]|uniref:pentatricopeptide repeat-containing protein At4g38010 n=1 Tax=Magnolia sinica TaxID=86752 RepID=UPI002657B567|nr:pentatricopeptide repeat-containing protein At4g38010 [Magnolia sinica]